MKTEIKLNSQLVIIETPNTSASPGLVGCQCESGLAPESDTSTAVEHQCEASCSACLVCLPALCCIGKPHTCTSTTLHLLGRRVGHVTRTHPSLPASMLVTRSSHPTGCQLAPMSYKYKPTNTEENCGLRFASLKQKKKIPTAAIVENQ